MKNAKRYTNVYNMKTVKRIGKEAGKRIKSKKIKEK